jgi:hypothetical protein
MKSAVEWLENHIDKEINKYSRQPMDLNAIHALNYIKHYACKKAKEMEKQQIVKSYHEGQLSVFNIVEESLTPLGFDSTSDKEDKEDAIDYYNKAFKQQEQ